MCVCIYIIKNHHTITHIYLIVFHIRTCHLIHHVQDEIIFPSQNASALVTGNDSYYESVPCIFKSSRGFFRFRFPAPEKQWTAMFPRVKTGLERRNGAGGGKGVTAKINQARTDAATFLVQLYQL